LEERFCQVTSAFDTNPRFVLAATIHIVYSDSALGIFWEEALKCGIPLVTCY
jgi:hypothetical protein